MENKPNNVFDKLDTLIAQNEEILDLLKNTKNTKNTNNQTTEKVNSKPKENTDSYSDGKQILGKFIKDSKKEYVWFGTISDFSRSKSIVYILAVALIVVGFISTVLTSFSVKVYSTFSIFENIWVGASIFMFSYSIKAKKRMLDSDLMVHSTSVFNRNTVEEFWFDTNQEKKKYKWFRRLSYIAVAANIIFIWTQSKGGIAVPATIFEIIFLGLSIGFYFAHSNLFCMYGTVLFLTGKNLTNTATVTLVFDSIQKKLITYDEIDDTIKKCL